jgi:hypothetical protein
MVPEKIMKEKIDSVNKIEKQEKAKRIESKITCPKLSHYKKKDGE